MMYQYFEPLVHSSCLLSSSKEQKQAERYTVEKNSHERNTGLTGQNEGNLFFFTLRVTCQYEHI